MYYMNSSVYHCNTSKQGTGLKVYYSKKGKAEWTCPEEGFWFNYGTEVTVRCSEKVCLLQNFGALVKYNLHSYRWYFKGKVMLLLNLETNTSTTRVLPKCCTMLCIRQAAHSITEPSGIWVQLINISTNSYSFHFFMGNTDKNMIFECSNWKSGFSLLPLLVALSAGSRWCCESEEKQQQRRGPEALAGKELELKKEKMEIETVISK